MAALLAVSIVARAQGTPQAVLLVDEDLAQPMPHTPARLPLAFAREGGSEVALAQTADGALALTAMLTPGDDVAGRLLELEATWHKRAWVHQVAVELTLPGERVELMGRDLEPTTLARGHVAWLERFDPKWIAVTRGGVRSVITVDDGVDAVWVRSDGKQVTVRIDLESAEARPFVHDARCTTNWHAPNQHLQLRARLRVPDEKVTARAQLAPGGTVPLVKARWPDGRNAALVWTDHADQTSARTLEALAHGFIAHHLQLTKALFAHGADRPQLEDPRVVKLADELAEAGSEIVPHSATPKPDPRVVTESALRTFERWKTRTWIDHQPETNCEAFGDQGYHVGGRFGIADLLSAHQYRYVWAEDDASPGDLDLLSPRHLEHRAPTVWPIGRLDLGGPEGLWMFRTEWAFIEAKRFYAMYGAPALDRLEREHGLHVAHTYLETYHPKATKFGLRNLLVPADPKHDKPGGPGPVVLDPRFDALLGALEMRQARGSLWVPTLGALGDRLRATAEVTLRLLPDGSVRVHTETPLAGATFAVAQKDASVTIGGHSPRGQRTDGNVTLFWADLQPGDTIITIGAP